jgi:hypothetical protein
VDKTFRTEGEEERLRAERRGWVGENGRLKKEGRGRESEYRKIMTGRGY